MDGIKTRLAAVARVTSFAVIIAAALAACGGSKHSTSTTQTSATTAASLSTPTSSTTTTHTHSSSSTKTHTTATSTHTTSSHTTSTHSTTTATHTHTTSTTSTHTTSTAISVLVRPLKATLVGANHSPTISKPWTYTVTATDAVGHPLSGTVDVEFTFQGQVVGHDTPPTHAFKNGRWQEVLTYPPQSLGQPIALQVVVHTSIGSKTLSWPVKTKR